MGFFGVLGLIFITLKLVGVITWSWWLVTLPLWGGFALFFVFFIIAAIIHGFAAAAHKALK